MQQTVARTSSNHKKTFSTDLFIDCPKIKHWSPYLSAIIGSQQSVLIVLMTIICLLCFVFFCLLFSEQSAMRKKCSCSSFLFLLLSFLSNVDFCCIDKSKKHIQNVSGSFVLSLWQKSKGVWSTILSDAILEETKTTRQGEEARNEYVVATPDLSNRSNRFCWRSHRTTSSRPYQLVFSRPIFCLRYIIATHSTSDSPLFFVLSYQRWEQVTRWSDETMENFVHTHTHTREQVESVEDRRGEMYRERTGFWSN